MFTDEDSKRLRECQFQDEEIWAGLFNYYTKETEKVNISALLARLEAAEDLINSIGSYAKEFRKYEAWRTAAGKDAK